jgi:small-conductance mechanosensitive channel
MEYLAELKQLLLDSLSQLLGTVTNYLPSLLGAVVLIITGLVLGALLKWLIIRLSAGLDRMVNVVGITSIPVLRNWPIGVILGWLAFWLIILFFVTAAADTLGLPGLANWLSNLINNLPVYFIAAVSVIAGIWIGNYVNNKIQQSTSDTSQHQVQILAQTLRIIIIAFAVISALSQIGLDVSLFETMMVILVAAVLAGLALAFGLGAGPTLANVISGRYVKKTYQLGQRVIIDEIEGEILELLPTGVVLDTEKGRTFVPAKLFGETVSVLLDNEEK